MFHRAGKTASLVLTALLALAPLAACGDDSDGSGGDDDEDAAGNAPAEPGEDVDDPSAGGTATLRRIGSCDEVAAVLGDYIAGFGPGTTGFNVEEERFDCAWKREQDPEGERIYAVSVEGIYTNTPDFANDDWEVAGLQVMEDPRVDALDGVLLLQDLAPVNRTVFIEAPGFELRLATNGRDMSYLPLDEMINLMFELIDD